MTSSHRAHLLPFLALLAVSPALASDGVLEINQTCATQLGCFPGDGGGLPVTIGQPGSYRLTSNLAVPDENTDGIVVNAPDVSIDLAGFTIAGPNHCGVPPAGCSLSGTGFGIHGVADRLHVSNGSVVGQGSVGIYSDSGGGHEIRNVWSAENRYQGIRIDGAAATVEGSTAIRNGATGILLGAGARVLGNVADQNGEMGIRAETGSSVSANTAYGNGSDGISAGVGSTIQGNTVRSNAVFGLSLSAFSAYRENTISNNGSTVLGGTDAGGNVCNGSLTCP